MSARPQGIRASTVGADLLALSRHFRIRLRAVSTDPFAMAFLALAGLSTIPIWSYGLGFDPLAVTLVDAALRTAFWPTPGYSGPLYSALVAFDGALVLCLLLWVPLVAQQVSGNVLRPTPSSGRGPAFPALPIGPRSRSVAEALVGLVLALLWRALAFLPDIGWRPYYTRQLHEMYGGPAIVTRTTLLGALVALPLLLAWNAISRFDWGGLQKALLVTTLLLAAMKVGAMAFPPTAVVLSLALAALVLVRVDDDDGPDAFGGADRGPASLSRPSPGASAQLRRDWWLGPLRTPRLFLAIVLPLLLLVSVLPARTFGLLALLLLLLLGSVLAFPFGQKLVSAGGPLLSGHFVRVWSPLPVRRESIVRGVCAHGLVAGGILWLLLLAYASAHHWPAYVPVYELPGVILVAAAMVCEAVGDRKRGSLALAALVAFQVGAPLIVASLGEVLDFPKRNVLLAVAYGLALIGGVPPLVHLRPLRRRDDGATLR